MFLWYIYIRLGLGLYWNMVEALGERVLKGWFLEYQPNLVCIKWVNPSPYNLTGNPSPYNHGNPVELYTQSKDFVKDKE